jgi:histidine ammonia-lyase
MKYYIKGSAANRNKHGFVFSNANWDPYPISNRLEAFTIALANMDVAVMLRQERFQSTFFTVVKASDVLPAQAGGGGGGGGGGWVNHEVWQTIQGMINPVPPEGYSSDPEGVEELDAEALFKVRRAAEAVDQSWMLAASDLLMGARWLDIRKAQDGSRMFGAAPTAAVAALRKVVPLQPPAGQATGPAALDFIKSTPASTFYPDGPAMPK